MSLALHPEIDDPIVETRRGQMPYSPTKPSKEIVDKLKLLDKNLELYYHPVEQTWMVYLVKFYGPVPSDDLLIQQVELDPGVNPGPWLVEKLRQTEGKITNRGQWGPDIIAKEIKRILTMRLAAQYLRRAAPQQALAEMLALEVKQRFVNKRVQVGPGRFLNGSASRAGRIRIHV